MMETSISEKNQPFTSGGLLEEATDRIVAREFDRLPQNDSFREAFHFADRLEVGYDGQYSDAEKNAIITSAQDKYWLSNTTVIDGMVGARKNIPAEMLTSVVEDKIVAERVLHQAREMLKERVDSSSSLRGETLVEASIEVEKAKNMLDAIESSQSSMPNLEVRLAGARQSLELAQQSRDNLRSVIESMDLTAEAIAQFVALSETRPEEFHTSIRRAMDQVEERVIDVLYELNEGRSKFDTGKMQAFISAAPSTDEIERAIPESSGEIIIDDATRLAARAIVSRK